MKKRIFTILLFVTICSFFICFICYGNQNYENKFNEGNSLYEKGNYKGAENIYEDIIKSGVINPYLYYNAANAAFKAGSTGKAMLYYERALRMSPRDEDIKQNLKYITMRVLLLK